MDDLGISIDKTLFSEYQSAFRVLVKKLGENTPRSLRLFDYRFRLALAVQIDFDDTIASVKTKKVKDCYRLIIKLTELWKSFEAFTVFLTDEFKIKNKFKIKDWRQIHSNALFKNFDINGIFQMCFKALRKHYGKPSFARDFDEYITRLENEAKLKSPLKTAAKNLRESLIKNADANAEDLLSVIYAERNLYFHNGEAAKMGSDYNSRQIVLKLYINFLSVYLFKLSIYAFKKL